MSTVDGGREKSEGATEVLWDQRHKDSPATGREDEMDLHVGRSMMRALAGRREGVLGALGEKMGNDESENLKINSRSRSPKTPLMNRGLIIVAR